MPWAFGSSWYEGHKRDRLSRACGRCEIVVPKSEIGKWERIRDPTNKLKGENRRAYTCQSCGYRGSFVQMLPMYDAVRYRSDGSPHYYNHRRDYESGSSSGGSSSGGGGGASW